MFDRGGGSKLMDGSFNLMAACRTSVISLHFQAGDEKREARVEHPARGTAVFSRLSRHAFLALQPHPSSACPLSPEKRKNITPVL